MKSFISVVPNVLASLGRVRLYLVVPATMGLTVFAMTELNGDINHSLASAAIFGGQAAQGDAQGADAPKTREALRDNKPLSNAGALIGAQIENTLADARKKNAESPQQEQIGIASKESIEDIIYKKNHGMPLSSTEELLLIDARTKAAQARQAEIGADIQADVYKEFFASGNLHSIERADEWSGRLFGAAPQPAAPAPKVAVAPPVAQPLPPVVVAPPAYYNYAYNYPVPPQHRVMRPVAPGVGFFNRRPLPRFFNPAARPQPITGFPLAGRY